MIRRAQEEDLSQISSLYNQYLLDINKINDLEYISKVEREGFIVEAGEKEDLLKRIKNDVVFNVYEEEGKIIGFINLNKEIYFPEEAENIIWIDPSAKQEYFHNEMSLSLHLIAVDSQYGRQGIAGELLSEAEEILRTARYTSIFSIIATGPVKNYPSLNFHGKNGFALVCKTQPVELFELKNYESELYKKSIFDISQKGQIL